MVPTGRTRLRGLGVLATVLLGLPVAADSPPRASERAAIASRSPTGLARGKFLVASRKLLDPNFTKTVVLLVEYGEEGAMGLIINRPTEVTLADLLPELEGVGETVYIGGPVAVNHMLLLLRTESTPEEGQRVLPNVYISGSRTLLERLLHGPSREERFRVYAGHAGWAPGQLDAEVARGDWHILPADGAMVFDDAPLELWPELIQQSSVQWTGLPSPPAPRGSRAALSAHQM